MIKKIAAGIIAITLILMGGVFLFVEDVSVAISEIEAQTAIDEYLAVNELGVLGISLSPKNVSIDFKANNTAQVKTDMLIEGPGYTGKFDGVFATGINYRAPRLYLDDLQLIEGGFQADDSTQSDLKDLIRKSTINLERDFVEETIVKTTKLVFESIPIFDLKTAAKTGMVASLAFKDVRFTENVAIFKFSLVTALLRILIAIGMIFLLIAWLAGPAIIGFFIDKAIQ